MQLWQRQLMYKKLQELQRQQQLQQLDQGAREQNSLSHSSASAISVAYFPSVINEMPVNDTWNNTWPNNFVGGMPIVPNNSQMPIAGNMNWAQASGSLGMHNLANGHILPDNQSQTLQSMGFMPQSLDQSFYGMPVSSNRPFANQYSQFFGMSNDGTGLMTKAAGYQTEEISDPYNNFQTDQCFPEQGCPQDRISVTKNFEGKGILGNNPMQILSSDLASGTFQQENHMQDSLQFQELHGRQEQDDWSGNLQEKSAVQVEISSGVTSLDPTEEKLLFGADDDDNWGASFGGNLNSFMGCQPPGHPSQSEYFGALPSVQSGSWSALMQEAVQASVSDQGAHEEWSGLSSQRTEQSMLKHSNAFNDIGKQLAAWNDSNLQNASSSTSRPPPLFYDADEDPNSRNFPSFQHTFNSSHDGNNRVLTKVPNVSFHLSTGEANKIQVLQNQEQKQYLESGLQLQMPPTNGIWAGHTYDEKENISHVLFKSQNIAGFTQQENMSFSSLNRKHSNGPNGSSTSYPMAPGGDGTSHICEADSNVWKLGASHVTLNDGTQPFKSSIGNSQVQTEGSLMGNFGSVMNSNTLNLTREMNQQVTNRHQIVFGKSFTHDTCVNPQGNENMGRSQNQPSRRQTWETLINSTNKRLIDTYDSKNEHPEVFSGEGYTSSRSNHGQDTNYAVAVKENPILIGSQNYLLGNHKYSTQSGQRNVESSIPPIHLPNFHGLADVVFQGSKSPVTKYVGNSKFESHDVLTNPMDVAKSFANGAQELQPRDSITIHDSHGTFDGITAQSSEKKRISQSSQNIEPLLEVDQPRDGDEMNAPVIPAQAAADVTASHPHFNQLSTMHGIGLWLSPPSQKQPPPNFEVSHQTSLINHRQPLDKEAGDSDQTLSTSAPVRSLPPHGASQVENWRNTYGQEHKRTSGSNQINLLPSIPYDISYGGNQLQEKQQQQQHLPGSKYQLAQQQQQEKHVSNSSGYETLGHHQTVDISLGSQANASILVNNDLLLREPPVTRNGDAVDQSVQTSLPTPAGRVPPSWVALASDTRAPSYPQEVDHTKATSAGFPHVKSSGQEFPVMETRSGSQSSIPGMSQQVGFSKMLHYVWANLSAQQRLAGLQPHRVAPNILQSIINNGRDTSSWGLQKADGQGNLEESTPSEIGTSSVNSQDRDHQVVVNSFKPKHSDNADSALSGSTSQGQEPVRSNTFDGGSKVSIPSLFQHHQDVDKGKSEEGLGFHSQLVHAPVTNIASRSDACFSGHTSVSSESPQQNYSLLHQMQVIKGADSDSSMILGKRLKGAYIGSNASQMEQNAGQRFVYGQNTIFKVPADGKLGVVSQNSFPSDVKMLSFASEDNERHASISSIAEHHDLQNHMHSLSTSSSANLMRGNEHYKISPQMNSSWFEKYVTYKKDMTSDKHDGNCLPWSMENSSIVEQRMNSNKFGSTRQSTLATTMAANESSDLSLPPTVMDHSILLRSKKRKSATSELLPWHKEISQGLRRLQSTSMAELAWAQVANRLIEKVGDEAETIEDSLLMFQPQRRLILTTQMIQQLLPAVPAALLNVEATSAYERVTYYVAKSALANACSQISSFGRDSCVEDVNLITKKVKSSVVGDHIFSKIVEEFSERSKRLGSEFSRLDKRTSMLDVRLECQELERFSIVNRLVKFHGRNQTDGVEGSSTSETAPRKTFPQRYVTALSLPGNLPESVLCLSL